MRVNVTVVEARDRIGGSVSRILFAKQKLTFELGAEWVGGATKIKALSVISNSLQKNQLRLSLQNGKVSRPGNGDFRRKQSLHLKKPKVQYEKPHALQQTKLQNSIGGYTSKIGFKGNICACAI